MSLNEPGSEQMVFGAQACQQEVRENQQFVLLSTQDTLYHLFLGPVVVGRSAKRGFIRCLMEE